MAPRTITGNIERELGRLGEALENAKEDRAEFKLAVAELSAQISELNGSFRGMSQTVQSTASQIAGLALEKCGERLDILESKTANLPSLERDMDFWRRLIGAGWAAFWRIVGLAVGSGAIGALIAKIWH